MSRIIKHRFSGFHSARQGRLRRRDTPSVVMHRTREDLLGDNGGTFTFDGLESGLRRAKEAAGDKEVWVMGAGAAQGLIAAGLLDVVRIHLVPLLMGEGTRLFAGHKIDLIPDGKPVAGTVTHLRYRVSKP